MSGPPIPKAKLASQTWPLISNVSLGNESFVVFQPVKRVILTETNDRMFKKCLWSLLDVFNGNTKRFYVLGSLELQQRLDRSIWWKTNTLHGDEAKAPSVPEEDSFPGF